MQVINAQRRDLQMLTQENDDLRERLQYMEAMTGWDSQNLRDLVSEEGQGRVDWAQFLLNMENKKEDIKILSASKDKIATELIKLRAENQKL